MRPIACLVPLVLALLPACESGSGSVRPAAGVSLVEDADAAAVGLLNADPARPFTVVGRVRSFADARFEGRIAAARSAAEAELRRQGAAVGADAVVIDESVVADLEGGAIESGLAGFDDDANLQRPGGSAYATRPVKRVILTGRAVRWEGGGD